VNRQAFASPHYLAIPRDLRYRQIKRVGFVMSKNTHARLAPPFRLGGARACFSHRIIKDHPHCPDILSLRQNRPTLANVSGRWSLLDGMSAIVAGSFYGANPMNSPSPARLPSRMQTMPGKSLATSLKPKRRALNDMRFRTWSRKVRETRSSSSQKRSEPAAHPCRGPGGQAADEHGGPPWFKGTRGRRGLNRRRWDRAGDLKKSSSRLEGRRCEGER